MPITTTELADLVGHGLHKQSASVGFGILGPREDGDTIVVMTGDQRFRVTVTEVADDDFERP